MRVGDEAVIIGFNDENREVIDVVVDGIPSHVDRLCAEWFPVMKDARARANE